MEVAIFFGWIIIALIAGLFGINKRIGYGKTFLISLLFSPFVAIIAACCSTYCDEYDMEKEKLKLLKELRDKMVGIEKKVMLDPVGEIKSIDGKTVKYELKSESLGNKERIKVTFEDGKSGNLYPVDGTMEFSFIVSGKFIEYKDKDSALRALYHYLNTSEVTNQGKTN